MLCIVTVFPAVQCFDINNKIRQTRSTKHHALVTETPLTPGISYLTLEYSMIEEPCKSLNIRIEVMARAKGIVKQARCANLQ